MGISLFAGEAEGRLDEVLRDADAGALKPLYNFMNDLPGIEGAPIPLLPARARRSAPPARVTSFDAGRGCPYQCSFCTIINVQGRKSRRRSPDDIEQIVRDNLAQGLHTLLHHRRQLRPQQGLGADPRPPDPAARGREAQVQLHHPGRHALPQAPELHREVRARRRATACSSGWRTSTPTTCVGARSGRTRSPNTARCCWPGRRRGVITYAGYILGFPNDTHGVDPARHRDHQARAAGRPARVLLS